MYDNLTHKYIPRPEGANEIEIRARAMEKKMALLAAEYRAEAARAPKLANNFNHGWFTSLLNFLKAPRRQLASVTHK